MCQHTHGVVAGRVFIPPRPLFSGWYTVLHWVCVELRVLSVCLHWGKRQSENKCSCTVKLEWNPSLNGYNFTYIYFIYIRRISLFSTSIGVWSGHAFCFNFGDETAEPFARWWWFTTGRSLKNEEAFFSKDTKKIEERPRRSAGRDLCMGKGRRKEEKRAWWIKIEWNGARDTRVGKYGPYQ